MSNLTPDYRDIDFQTMMERLRTLLSNTDNFRDYDFEGSNITILMELVSYVGDLNTYLTNKLAQNIHTETANIYEVVHSLSRQQGHEPCGYVSSELTLNVRVYMQNERQTTTYYQEGDEIFVPQWFRIDTGEVTGNGDPIYYTLTEPYTYQVVGDDVIKGYLDIKLVFRQGVLNYFGEYTGNDIVSNQIVLPFQNWDMGTYPYNNSAPSIQVVVGDDEVQWTRINDFYDNISGLLDENNAYMLLYDKYERSVLSFSNTRNIPKLTDPIKIWVIETLGLDGVITSDVWSVDSMTTPERWVQSKGIIPDISSVMGYDVNFITNNNPLVGKIPTTQYIILNNSGSIGGSNPQSMVELKNAGKSAAQAQQRNVTKSDYIGNLERRGDIVVANAWGEHEDNPGSLNIMDYNKAYISVIPSEWDNDVHNNILSKNVLINNTFSRDLEYVVQFPTRYTTSNTYNPLWEQELLRYLEPRKMLGIYEHFILPDLVYFRFDFGLKVKRSYNWTQVRNTIRNKLEYYFKNHNRSFGEIIDFRDIVDYITNTSNVSPVDDFSLVRGIQYLTVRDIMIYRDTDLIESDIPIEVCSELGGGYTGSPSQINYVNKTNITGSGWYWSLPSTNITGTGSGATFNITVNSGIITNLYNNSIGSGYRVGDTLQINGSDVNPAFTGVIDITVISIFNKSCDIIPDEMYIYPENSHNYYPQYKELGYVQNDQDLTYNDLQPIQMGFNQFPRIDIDLCVFTNEG